VEEKKFFAKDTAWFSEKRAEWCLKLEVWFSTLREHDDIHFTQIVDCREVR